jgi:hypothetical protein
MTNKIIKPVMMPSEKLIKLLKLISMGPKENNVIVHHLYYTSK